MNKFLEIYNLIMESLNHGYKAHTPIDLNHFPLTQKLKIPFSFEFSFHAFSTKKNHGVMKLHQYSNNEILDKLDHAMFKILSRQSLKAKIENLNGKSIKFEVITKDKQIIFVLAAEYINDVFNFSLITTYPLSKNQFNKATNNKISNRGSQFIQIESENDSYLQL